MKKHEFEIEVCYKCNWNCNYCCVQTHTKKPITDNEIKEKFLSYQIKDSNITVSGGEPSFATDHLLIFLIEYSFLNRCKLNLNTNGRFFEAKPELIKYFNEINYHVSENLKPEKIKEYTVPDNVKVNYLIILTDKNIKRLHQFIDINREFINRNKLLIIPASNPYGVEGPILSPENYKFVLANFRNFMTNESRLRFVTMNKTFKESEITYITNFKAQDVHPNK